MPRSDDASEKLRRHFESTDLSLRIGIAAIGVAPYLAARDEAHAAKVRS